MSNRYAINLPSVTVEVVGMNPGYGFDYGVSVIGNRVGALTANPLHPEAARVLARALLMIADLTEAVERAR